MPFVFKEKVEAELVRLQNLGIISPVQLSRWDAPIPVVKQDGSVRICGDFKVTINQVSQVESYPLPRVEELFATLSGGKQFSKLDLAQAYLQLPLAEDSKYFVTINTSKGLFQYNRFPFGVSSAPTIFQGCIENLLQGCKGVAIVFSTKKFHNYLYGRFFYIESDHQILFYVFNEAGEIPHMASSQNGSYLKSISVFYPLQARKNVK